MLKEVRTGYKGMYTNLNGTRRFCLVYFDNDGYVIGYYDRGNFVDVNDDVWGHNKGGYESLPTNRYTIYIVRMTKKLSSTSCICAKTFFEKDDYSGMVGG